MANEVTGRTITRQVISEDAMIRNVQAAGVPENVIEIILGYYRAARAGEFATVDTTLGHLLDREPRTMRGVLSQALG